MKNQNDNALVRFPFHLLICVQVHFPLRTTSASVFIWSIFFYFAGGDGAPSGPLRRGQARGGRVRVSLSHLRWGDPLQRGKNLTSTHLPGAAAHVLLLSINLILPHLSSSSSNCSPQFGSWLTVYQTWLSAGSSHHKQSSSGCCSQPAAYFWTFFGRGVRANWSWQSHAVHVMLLLLRWAFPLTSRMFVVDGSLWQMGTLYCSLHFRAFLAHNSNF